MKKRWVLLVGVLLLLAAAWAWRYYRLEIIRAAIHLPLQGWIFYLLWGW